MERILCLVLDEEAKIKLPLFEGTPDEIDQYTTKFANAEDLRKKYKVQIDNFLEENKEFLESRDPEKKKYNGRIVVLENQNGIYEQKRVLFKKHLIAFKNFIYKDRATMQEFVHLQNIGYTQHNKKKLLTSFVINKISYSGNYQYKTKVEEIRRDINASSAFYDIVRIIIKAYKHQRELRPNLPTIEAIYQEYVETKKQQKEERDAKKRADKEKLEELKEALSSHAFKPHVRPNNDDEEIEFVINGIKYNADELHLFDLEDIDVETSNIIPDGMGIDEKTHK